ncbi:MAG: protein kinase [Planctomycetes bacterium]|nr:protein kinase [Planctomycetota bacterium]
MLSFSCASCQKKLAVKEEYAGKKVKCPGCGTVTRIPGGAAVTQAAPTGHPRASSLGPSSPEVSSPHVRSAPPMTDERTVPPAAAGRSGALPTSDRPTVPPSSESRATPAPVPEQADHDSSLTDFLAPAQADDELGRLGGFRILKILGHGGMGVVFLGEDPKLGRNVAIKAMLPHLAESKSAQQRFLREARAAAALEHDHIVAIHHVDEDRGAPFIVMPFLKGEPLDARLHREEGLPLREVLRIAREVAEGLACAHQSGLIHRDIKPANIWLETQSRARQEAGARHGVGPTPLPDGRGSDFRIKILDFGLARASSQEAGLTQQGAIIGTPSYMAPEQARGETVDARCDLWSLGVVLYRLCTGTLPFHGNDAVSTLMAVAMHDPPAPVEVNPKLRPELSELVMHLLEKDPAQRIATAQEVVNALRELEQSPVPSDHVIVSKTVSTPKGQSTQRLSQSGRRKSATEIAHESEWGPRRHANKSRLPLFLGLGGCLAVVVIGAGFIFLPSTNEKKVINDAGPSPLDPPTKPPTIAKPTGAPISRMALVQRPAKIPGIESWSIETRGHLGVANDPRQLALSPDPERFATGGQDGSIRIWQRKAGELHLVRLLLGHDTPVNFVDWSPDGKWIASAGHDNTVRLWDSNTGKLLRTLAKHTAIVSALAWSPDSKMLATGSHDTMALVWDVTTGKAVTTFALHQGHITEIGWQTDATVVSMDAGFHAWSWDAKSGNSLKTHTIKRLWLNFYAWGANRSMLAYISGDDQVTFWNPATDETRPLKLNEIQGRLEILALSPDGKTLATAANKENVATVQIWDTTSGRLISSGRHGVWFLAFSPDGKTVASTSTYGGGTLLWNADPGSKDVNLEPLAKPIGQLLTLGNYVWNRWSADGKSLYSKNGLSVAIHDPKAAKAKMSASAPGQDPTVGPSFVVPVHEPGSDVAWSPDAKRVVTIHPWNWTTQVWDAETGVFLHQLGDRESVSPQAWSPDGKTLARTMHYGNTLKLWHVGEATPDKLLPTKGLRAIAWSSDGQRFATAEENSVRIWDVAGAKDVQSLPVTAEPHRLAWSPDSEQVALVAAGEKAVSLWEVKSGKPVPTEFEGHKSQVNGLAWSPDGRLVATGDQTGMIRLSNAKSGASQKFFQAHDGPLQTLVWQDHTTLVSLGGILRPGNQGGTVHFWQLDGDKPIRSLKGMPAAGKFSPGGKFLTPVAGGDWGYQSPSRQIWDMHTGLLRGTLAHFQENPHQAVAISADGHYRLTGDALRHVVCVVQSAEGQQFFSPEEFANRFGWKNDPQRVRLTQP